MLSKISIEYIVQISTVGILLVSFHIITLLQIWLAHTFDMAEESQQNAVELCHRAISCVTMW